MFEEIMSWEHLVKSADARTVLSEHIEQDVKYGIFDSYRDANDTHHGGVIDLTYAGQLQEKKSKFARSEFPIIPYFWLIKNDEDEVHQYMLDLEKIDPDNGQIPVLNFETSGMHCSVTGRIIVAALDPEYNVKWHNEHFNETQVKLLVSQAIEIEGLLA